MNEYDKNLITALRTAHSRSRRELFDATANRLEALLAENERLRDSARRLWAGMPRYCGDLPRFAMHEDEPPSIEGVE